MNSEAKSKTGDKLLLLSIIFSTIMLFMTAINISELIESSGVGIYRVSARDLLGSEQKTSYTISEDLIDIFKKSETVANKVKDTYGKELSELEIKECYYDVIEVAVEDKTDTSLIGYIKQSISNEKTKVLDIKSANITKRTDVIKVEGSLKKGVRDNKEIFTIGNLVLAPSKVLEEFIGDFNISAELAYNIDSKHGDIIKEYYVIGVNIK